MLDGDGFIPADVLAQLAFNGRPLVQLTPQDVVGDMAGETPEEIRAYVDRMSHFKGSLFSLYNIGEDFIDAEPIQFFVGTKGLMLFAEEPEPQDAPNSALQWPVLEGPGADGAIFYFGDSYAAHPWFAADSDSMIAFTSDVNSSDMTAGEVAALLKEKFGISIAGYLVAGKTSEEVPRPAFMINE